MSDKTTFVSFVCAACGQELEGPSSQIGKAVECPSCGARIVVTPRANTASSTPTAKQIEAMKSRTIRIELGDL